MRFISIRPNNPRKRRRAKVALYTVVFSVGEIRPHDSAFDGFCREGCEHRIANNCEEQCNSDGEYGRLLYNWRNNDYLIRYFKNLRHLLNSERYGNIDIKCAIQRHRLLVTEIDECLQKGDLNSLFINL